MISALLQLAIMDDKPPIKAMERMTSYYSWKQFSDESKRALYRLEMATAKKEIGQ